MVQVRGEQTEGQEEPTTSQNGLEMMEIMDICSINKPLKPLK